MFLQRILFETTCFNLRKQLQWGPLCSLYSEKKLTEIFCLKNMPEINSFWQVFFTTNLALLKVYVVSDSQVTSWIRYKQMNANAMPMWLFENLTFSGSGGWIKIYKIEGFNSYNESFSNGIISFAHESSDNLFTFKSETEKIEKLKSPAWATIVARKFRPYLVNR